MQTARPDSLSAEAPASSTNAPPMRYPGEVFFYIGLPWAVPPDASAVFIDWTKRDLDESGPDLDTIAPGRSRPRLLDSDVQAPRELNWSKWIDALAEPDRETQARLDIEQTTYVTAYQRLRDALKWLAARLLR